MGNKLALAISIAAQAFETKLDKGGQPYILHCLRVMNNTKGDEQEEETPIGIMDFNPNQLSIGLVKKLIDHKPYTYEDTNDMQEHLYAPDEIVEQAQVHGWILNDEEENELQGIQEKMNAKNCGYFRMVVI